MKKMAAQLADLLEQVVLVPWGQRMQDAQPQLRARLSRSIGSTQGSHVVLFTASKWQSRHPHQKNSSRGRAGMGESLPFIVRRHPMRPPPTRGDLERKCWRSREGTGSASVNQAPCRPLAYDGGVRRARVRPRRCKSLAETRAPTAIPRASGAFRSITRWLAYFGKSRRKWAVPRRHHALVCGFDAQ